MLDSSDNHYTTGTSYINVLTLSLLMKAKYLLTCWPVSSDMTGAGNIKTLTKIHNNMGKIIIIRQPHKYVWDSVDSLSQWTVVCWPKQSASTHFSAGIKQLNLVLNK